MTTVFAFFLGVFVSGAVLALVFGALCLEAKDKAYRKGYYAGICKAHDIVKEWIK